MSPPPNKRETSERTGIGAKMNSRIGFSGSVKRFTPVKIGCSTSEKNGPALIPTFVNEMEGAPNDPGSALVQAHVNEKSPWTFGSFSVMASVSAENDDRP